MSRFAYDKITKESTLIAGSQSPIVIAGTESTSTASQAYVVGQYLVYGGFLYKVISAIAQGDTLVIGTNISVTTVGDEITDIRDDLTANNATAGVTDVPFRFGCDDSGKFGYIITEGGADTVIPFSGGSNYVKLPDIYYAGEGSYTGQTVVRTIDVSDYKYLLISAYRSVAWGGGAGAGSITLQIDDGTPVTLQSVSGGSGDQIIYGTIYDVSENTTFKYTIYYIRWNYEAIYGIYAFY